MTEIRLKRTPADGHEDWVFAVVVEERGQRQEFRVVLSEIERRIAHLREPTPEWVNERLQAQARARLSDGAPVIEQLRTWRQPIPLFAPPR